jgi:hypothetical protein
VSKCSPRIIHSVDSFIFIRGASQGNLWLLKQGLIHNVENSALLWNSLMKLLMAESHDVEKFLCFPIWSAFQGRFQCEFKKKNRVFHEKEEGIEALILRIELVAEVSVREFKHFNLFLPKTIFIESRTESIPPIKVPKQTIWRSMKWKGAFDVLQRRKRISRVRNKKFDDISFDIFIIHLSGKAATSWSQDFRSRSISEELKRTPKKRPSCSHIEKSPIGDLIERPVQSKVIGGMIGMRGKSEGRASTDRGGSE